MSYVNVGVYVDGKRPKSKKAVKDALAADPARVTFDLTSPMGPQYADLSGVNVPQDVKLSVVGPDPYRDRRFYGTVSVSARTGKVTIV